MTSTMRFDRWENQAGNAAVTPELLVGGTGLVPVIPTGVTVPNGTASVSSTGVVSFTACSEININNCFTSTYSNYRVLVTFDTVTANTTFNTRLRTVSGGYSTTAYYAGGWYMYTNSAGSGSSGNRHNASAWASAAGIGSTDARHTLEFEFRNPALAKRTGMFVRGNSQDGTSPYAQMGSGWHDISSPYDGLTLFSDSGTIYLTGTIQVYGYR